MILSTKTDFSRTRTLLRLPWNIWNRLSTIHSRRNPSLVRIRSSHMITINKVLACCSCTTYHIHTMTEAALIAHLISQTQANVSFLQSNGYLSPSDAADVQNKLATAFTPKSTTNGLVSLTRNMSITSPPQPTAQIPSPRVSSPGRYQSPPPQSPFQPPQSSPYQQSTPYNQGPPSQPHWQPPAGPPPTSSYQSPPPLTVRARALWAYNENGKVSKRIIVK